MRSTSVDPAPTWTTRLPAERPARSPDGVAWSILAGEQLVGRTDLKDIAWIDRQAATRIVIAPAAWGRGYASEAVQLHTAYAFDELGLERLEAEAFAENGAMHRVLEKAGYGQFGRRRRAIYRGGAWHDLVLFEVLREEWRARGP